MPMIDYDKPLLCAECGSRVQVSIPTWVVPGDDHIELENVDYESKPISIWCPVCEEHNVQTDPQEPGPADCPPEPDRQYAPGSGEYNDMMFG